MVGSIAAVNTVGLDNSLAHKALLTVTQVAHRLNAHPHSVRRWADSGLLHCYRIGFRGDRRFKAEDMDAFLVTRIQGPYTE